MKRIIVDSCVWYACFDKTDTNYRYSEKIRNVLKIHDIIIPFPTLYETVNTRFVKINYGQMNGLFNYINNPSKVYLVDDSSYKEKAVSLVFSNVNNRYSYSLVDMIIRLMMEDISLGNIAVMTFNVKDFIGINNTEIINPEWI